MPALKPLAAPVRFAFGRVNMQALVASLAAIARIYQNQPYPSPQRFVGDKQPHLVKSPAIATPSLGFVAGLLIRASRSHLLM
jgi:hypothetical protein